MDGAATLSLTFGECNLDDAAGVGQRAGQTIELGDTESVTSATGEAISSASMSSPLLVTAIIRLSPVDRVGEASDWSVR